MTTRESIELIGLVVAGFPSPEWPRDTVRMRAALIEDLDYARAKRAIVELLQVAHGGEDVLPANIRAHVGRQFAAELGTEDAVWDGERALVAARRAMSRFGHHREFPVKRYPILWEVFEAMGGIRACSLSTDSEDASFRAHFLKLWDRVIDRHVRQASNSVGGEDVTSLRSPTEVKAINVKAGTADFASAKDILEKSGFLK